MERPRLFLIDAFGFIFRAYHARARSGAPPMRTSKGLSTEAVYIFHNMLRKLLATHRPEYVAAIFESAGPTFREQAYAAYKATRAEMPPDLAEQIPYVRRLLEALRVPVLEYPGFEADDVVGALARRAVEAGLDVVIVSSDKDMLQLVDEHTFMVNPVKEDEWYDAGKVEAFLGVKPWQVPDFLALKGDAIDNIPGAPGIGDKGARELIARFGSVENALEHAEEVERKTYRESLLNHRDQILLSKRLATIDTTAPVPFELDALRAQEPDPAALRQLYKELEFYSLLRELEPEQRVERDYRRLETAAEVDAYLAAIPRESPVAVALQARGEGELALGMAALAWRPGEARSLSLGLLDRLRPLLEDGSRPKITHDLKTMLLTLAECGVEPRGFNEDVMLYAFLLDADPSGCALEPLAERRLDRKLSASVEERAECVLELARLLGPEVDARGLRKLYEEIDLPLVPVLARMERTGIRIDPAALEALSRRLDTEIQRLSAEIQQMAGRPFNINSPQQLGKVLFEELKLPAPVRYGRGKTISTAADVLEELAAEHPIAAKVLEYRQLAKLKGTYVDALPQLINPRTGRLHTSFNQTGAATGRLSSSNPNLQNIPIRTELGREIRAAFVPREGWSLLVADYSQIELRLLAHMSRDPVLLEAFRKGEDIHTRTAAEVFGVPPLMVTPELRRNAKAVNFGIIYGLSAYGLSAQLGISREEAETYIRNYFARYAGVKRFIEETIATVRRTGETRTLFGRRRPIPDINSSNPNARGFAERTAINTPLQGTAADLIKLAMIRIDRELQARRWRTAMLLQVHDELLFESPPEEVQEAAAMVRREMENVYRLEVPLVVETGIGPNWRDAK
ncbi:MAG TPA: DNA polymerase I [Bryobacteraceae bacterium]|nr:DNA polymerase I [Bryobacteraceae bacterium]